MDLVAPGQWEEIIVKSSGQVDGRLPYHIKTKGFFKCVTTPPLTPYLGPWMRSPPEESKTSTRIPHKFELLDQLITMLPRCYIVAQPLHWSCTNYLPFHWAGFEPTTLYTYLLNLERSEQEIWAGLDETCRMQIRKARKFVCIREESDRVRLWDLWRSTYARQGIPSTLSASLLERVVAAGAQRGRGRVITAEDESRRLHAAGFFVWDNNTTHYLVGGSDAEFRSSGAASLILWEGIRLGQRLGCAVFDFEGSRIKAVKRFFRRYGGMLQPYSILRRLPIWLKLTFSVRRHIFSSARQKAL